MKSIFSTLSRPYAAAVLVGAVLCSGSAFAEVNAYSMVGGWNSIRGTGTVMIPTFGTFPKAQMPTVSILQDTTGGTITVPPRAFTFQANTATTTAFGNPGRIVGVSVLPFRQLRTNFSGVAPMEKMVLAPNGRTGGDVVSFCPQIGPGLPGATVLAGAQPSGWNPMDGFGVNPCPNLASAGVCHQVYNTPAPSFQGGYNPFCTNINATSMSQVGFGTISGVGISHGRLRYARTAGALGMGGTGQQARIGTGDLAVQIVPFGTGAVNTQPPFTNAAVFAFARLISEQLQEQASGASFDKFSTIMRHPGPANFVFATKPGNLGLIDPDGLGGGIGPPFLTEDGGTVILPSGVQSAWGGPWTTGQVKVSITKNGGAAIGNTHIFTLTGSDNRALPGGTGMIQLVSGSLSRTETSVTGQRAILTMNLTNLPEPSSFLGAGAALLALAGCRRFLRQR